MHLGFKNAIVIQVFFDWILNGQRPSKELDQPTTHFIVRVGMGQVPSLLSRRAETLSVVFHSWCQHGNKTHAPLHDILDWRVKKLPALLLWRAVQAQPLHFFAFECEVQFSFTNK